MNVVSFSVWFMLITLFSLSKRAAGNTTQSNESNSKTAFNHHQKELQENALTACFAVTAFISILGNTLVIHVVRTTPSMSTSVNVYIANMAVSDVISTIVCTALMIKQLAMNSLDWLGGTGGLVLCKLVFLMFYSSFACSTFNHVAIAIDRYIAVSRPLYRYSNKTMKIIVALSWCVSFLLSIPIADGYQLKSYKRNVDAMCFDSDRGLSYDLGVTLMAVMCYGIPLIAATALYTMTGYKLRMRSKQTIGSTSEHRKRQASKAAYKAIKLMVIVVAVFGLCWAPFFIYHMTKAWYPGALYKILDWYHRPLSFLFASTNAAMNPCLYFIFNDNFRKGFMKLMCRCRQSEHYLNTDFPLTRSRTLT